MLTHLTNSDEYILPLLDAEFSLVRSELTSKELFRYLKSVLESAISQQTRVVSLVGGPGSGKSTVTRALVEDLAEDGLKADVISTDDYNVGDREWRWRHFEGDTVRDPLGKWDFAFMNSKIDAIRQNKDVNVVVKVPTYDPATGIAIASGEENYTHSIGPVDVLFVEGDMFKVDQPDLAVYLHLPDALRLQNRISRDLEHRNGGDAQRVINNFNLRQLNQFFPYTLPAVEGANMIIWAKPTNREWLYDIYTRNS